MTVRRVRRLAAIACVALVAGCQREPAVQPSAPSASAAAQPLGAADDTPRALTDEVIARASVAMTTDLEGSPPRVIETGLDEYPKRVLIEPGLVLAPDAEHRLLVAMGTSVDESGIPDAADSWGRNLGLYAFTRQNGRWQLTNQVPSIAHGGQWKTGADFQALQLGGHRVGIAVTYMECHTGACSGTLEVLALSPQGAKRVLFEPLHYDSDGWSGPCDEMVKATLEAHAQGRTDFFASNMHCTLIDGRMRVQARGAQEWPDLVIDFTGEDVQIEANTFEVKRTAKAGELVLRYDGERYKPISGRNPIQD